MSRVISPGAAASYSSVMIHLNVVFEPMWSDANPVVLVWLYCYFKNPFFCWENMFWGTKSRYGLCLVKLFTFYSKYFNLTYFIVEMQVTALYGLKPAITTDFCYWLRWRAKKFWGSFSHGGFENHHISFFLFKTSASWSPQLRLLTTSVPIVHSQLVS